MELTETQVAQIHAHLKTIAAILAESHQGATQETIAAWAAAHVVPAPGNRLAFGDAWALCRRETGATVGRTHFANQLPYARYRSNSVCYLLDAALA
jgi:hypothetical protein